MKTPQQLNAELDPKLVRARNAIRRFVVKLTDAAIWQLAGVRTPDGIETRRAEVFGGIGIAARPPAGNESEAIGVMVGDANTPVVIAIRDEKTRAAVAGALGVDETMLFNTTALMLIKSDGTIEARSVGGAAVALATKADVQALRDYVRNQFSTATGHIHATPSGPTTTITTVNAAGSAPTHAPPSPSGTTVLKGE